MATRKWQAARRRRYRTRLVDVRTRPANLARSAAETIGPAAARDSQPFHVILEDHGLPLITIGLPDDER